MGSSRNKKKKRRKQSKPKFHEPEKIKDSQPVITVNPYAYKKETPVWQISKIDNGSKWGWSCVTKEQWEKHILPSLINRESMTWAEIEQQTHGKKNKTSNHEIEVNKFIPEARKRLEELKREDYDILYSLRVNGKIRVFGNRVERLFQIFWFDTEHEICPSIKD